MPVYALFLKKTQLFNEKDNPHLTFAAMHLVNENVFI